MQAICVFKVQRETHRIKLCCAAATQSPTRSGNTTNTRRGKKCLSCSFFIKKKIPLCCGGKRCFYHAFYCRFSWDLNYCGSGIWLAVAAIQGERLTSERHKKKRNFLLPAVWGGQCLPEQCMLESWHHLSYHHISYHNQPHNRDWWVTETHSLSHAFADLTAGELSCSEMCLCVSPVTRGFICTSFLVNHQNNCYRFSHMWLHPVSHWNRRE